MTLLVGGLLWLLMVLIALRWAEYGVEEAAERAEFLRRMTQVSGEFSQRFEALRERLLDADDPSVVAEGLGLAPRYRERVVPLGTFALTSPSVM